MKKIIALILALSMLAMLAACTGSNDGNDTTDDTKSDNISDTTANTTSDDSDTTPDETPSIDTIPLSGLLAAIKSISGIEFGRMFQEQAVSAEEMPFVLGCEEFTTGYSEALALSPMMNTTPFQLILFRLEDGADAGAFADEVKSKANPNKWICVTAETAVSAHRGNTVLLVMTSTDDAKLLTDAFNAIDPATYNPDDYVEKHPLDGKTMKEVFDLANEYTGYFSSANEATLTAENAADYGLSAIDIAAVSDSVVDRDMLDDTISVPYICGFFRISSDANPNYFAYEISESLDTSVLGENAYTKILIYEDIVVFYATTSEGNSLDFSTIISYNLQLPEYVVAEE